MIFQPSLEGAALGEANTEARVPSGEDDVVPRQRGMSCPPESPNYRGIARNADLWIAPRLGPSNTNAGASIGLSYRN